MPDIKPKKISKEDVVGLFSKPLEEIYNKYSNEPDLLGKAIVSSFYKEPDLLEKQGNGVEKKPTVALLLNTFCYEDFLEKSIKYVTQNQIADMLMSSEESDVVSDVENSISVFNEAYKNAREVIKEGSLINDVALYQLEEMNKIVQVFSIGFYAALPDALRRGEDTPTVSDSDHEESLAKAVNELKNELENANKKLIAKYGEENFKQVTTWFGTFVDSIVTYYTQGRLPEN